MKTVQLYCLTALIILLFSVTVHAEDPREIPTKNMVTMVDLGADKCIPCKLMAPIIDKLAHEYKGKAAVVFIDVWKNPDQAKRFKINAIPTQIFYDKSGKERFRHVGFMDEKQIRKQLETLLSI